MDGETSCAVPGSVRRVVPSAAPMRTHVTPSARLSQRGLGMRAGDNPGICGGFALRAWGNGLIGLFPQYRKSWTVSVDLTREQRDQPIFRVRSRNSTRVNARSRSGREQWMTIQATGLPGVMIRHVAAHGFRCDLRRVGSGP